MANTRESSLRVYNRAVELWHSQMSLIIGKELICLLVSSNWFEVGKLELHTSMKEMCPENQNGTGMTRRAMDHRVLGI